MNKELTKFSYDEIERLKKTPWDFGNQILYDLCERHHDHKTQEVIIAKVWLIGRSYAVAIERRKKKGLETSDEFYENIIADAFIKSDIDSQIASSADAPTALLTHKGLVNLLIKHTGHNNISFCSKYLHFHKPDHFFIYDSRAIKSLSLAMKLYDIAKPKKLSAPFTNKNVDQEYARFYQNALLLKDALEKGYSIERITPRHIDNILLHIDRMVNRNKITAYSL